MVLFPLSHKYVKPSMMMWRSAVLSRRCYQHISVSRRSAFLASRSSSSPTLPLLLKHYLSTRVPPYDDQVDQLSTEKLNLPGTFRCNTNYVPLSPISFLLRAGISHRDVPSIIHGDGVGFTWGQTLLRCKSLASALLRRGISYGEVVATFIPNTPQLYELHFGVPMAGAVICVLNVQNEAPLVSELLRRCDASVVFVGIELLSVVLEAIGLFPETTTSRIPNIIVIGKSSEDDDDTCRYLEYEDLLSMGKPDSFEVRGPKSEMDAISISFTSGTTSTPKPVVYSHRGSYLNSVAVGFINHQGERVADRPVYLWVVPMFHCNGWCHTWAMALLLGTNVFLKDWSAESIYNAIVRHGISHMGGAITILNMLLHTPEKKPLRRRVLVLCGGAAAPSEVIQRMDELGFSVIHSYGMTETYSAATVPFHETDWEMLSVEEKAKQNARHGINHWMMEEVDVKDPKSMRSVEWDGVTAGEVMFRGNTIMTGYYKNEEASLKAFKGGWFRTGDIGVRHPDGCLEFVDRSSDVVISRTGRMISTTQVEAVLYKHPDVREAAVVGVVDDMGVETPCTFVDLKDGSSANSEDIIRFCRDQLPDYMVPNWVVFEIPPKTASGKTKKNLLRKRARDITRNDQ